MPAPRHAAALLAALFALAGCGTQTLNTDDVERQIAGGIEQQTGAEGVTVECPEEIEIEAGAKFNCTAEAGGEEPRSRSPRRTTRAT